MKTVFPHDVIPQMIAEWGCRGNKVVERRDKSAIFDAELGVHHDVEVYVQCARCLRRFRDLNGHALAGIL